MLWLYRRQYKHYCFIYTVHFLHPHVLHIDAYINMYVCAQLSVSNARRSL